MSEPVTVAEVVVVAGRRGGDLVRAPRAVVKINGEAIDGMVSWSTSENEFSSPDSFGVLWATDGLPRDRGAAWFDALQRGAEVEIFVGYVSDPVNFTAADLSSVMVGLLDEIATDWVGGTIEISGRDLTAKMVDSKTSEKYINQTASQVAATLAAKHGLQTDITETAEKIGLLYKADKVDLHSERTEWDLLTWLARESGFVTYLQGRTLYFGPRADPASSPPFVITREAVAGEIDRGNYVALKTRRTLTVAGDITVKVHSWNHKQRKGFTRTAQRSTGGSKQEFSYSIPGLDPDQAQRKAELLLAELSQHERKLSYEGPGFALTIADLIRVEGTGSGFDAVFYPEAIEREFSADDGYGMSVSAKNHPTEDAGAL